MYQKDKTERMTVRLTKNQVDFIHLHAKEVGISPSVFVRSIINSFILRKEDEITEEEDS